MLDGLLTDGKDAVSAHFSSLVLVQHGQVKMLIDARGESVQDRQGFVSDKPLPSLLTSDATAL